MRHRSGGMYPELSDVVIRFSRPLERVSLSNKLKGEWNF